MRTMILAGGLATRNPFKCLLTVDAHGRNAIQKLYEDLCWSLPEERSPLVVVREGTPVHAFCKARGWDLRFQTEPFLAGALRVAVTGDDPAMIFCGDNVYTLFHYSMPMPVDTAAVLPEFIPGLAFWDGEKWDRDNGAESGPLRTLISPWCLSAKTMRTARWDQAHLIFNDAGVRPYFTERAGWHDIGTPEGYTALWDANA